jgi:hypothetical protein
MKPNSPATMVLRTQSETAASPERSSGQIYIQLSPVLLHRRCLLRLTTEETERVVPHVSLDDMCTPDLEVKARLVKTPKIL